jgi:hypothetical protein
MTKEQNYNGSTKHLENLEKARALSVATKGNCKICGREFTTSGVKNHEKFCKPCPVCGGFFSKKTATTCSHGCANTFFRSGADHGNWSANNYRMICFKAHGKKCIICNECNIVEVHHYDGDHKNNHQSNLIPLCPTHHQYWHSKYRYVVENRIRLFVELGSGA